MNGEQSALLEILNAIEYGNLSTEETRRRLEKLIDNEINKTDAPANIEIVDECEKLLWALNTKGKLPFISNLKSNKQSVLKRINRPFNARQVTKFTFQVASLAAIIFISVIGFDILFRKEWLINYSTPDEQQYIIQGQKNDPTLIDSASAIGDQTERTLTTTIYSDVISFLGFDPLADNAISANWTAEEYICFSSDENSSLRAYYVNGQDSLRITIDFYNSMSNVTTYVEQYSNGIHQDINGIDVYYAMNNGHFTSVWTTKNRIYMISTTIQINAALDFITNFLGGS